MIRMICPACSSRLKISHTELPTPLIRKQRAICSNEICGGVYEIFSELTRVIRSPSTLYNAPDIIVKKIDDSDRVAQAVIYIKDLNNKKDNKITDNEKIKLCAKYLYNNSSDISMAKASNISKIALYQVQKSNQYNVSSVQVASGSVIIFSGIDQHIVPLNKIVQRCLDDK